MNKILAIFSFLLTVNSHAFSKIEIESLCTDDKIVSVETNGIGLTLGELTVNILNHNQIDFIGSEYGINSIQGSPYGDEAIKIIGENEILAFGWCYQIDGKVSEKMPYEIIVDDSLKNVRWYYGFAHYLNGEWISQCEENKTLVKNYYCK